jgi:hypothetical protein
MYDDFVLKFIFIKVKKYVLYVVWRRQNSVFFVYLYFPLNNYKNCAALIASH